MTETGLAQNKPQTLDDVMIAMDVVDTLRHREDLVHRELNEEDRESELIARLRQIYSDQGIAVSDRVLAEGVKALKDSRFVYTPPPPRWKSTLLTWWVRREKYGRRLGIALAALIAVCAAHYVSRLAPGQSLNEGESARRDHRDVAQAAATGACRRDAGRRRRRRQAEGCRTLATASGRSAPAIGPP